VTAVPLRRNRDFVLLQTGQLLSSVGTQSTSIAYPLLVLGVTHSAAKTGIVRSRERSPGRCSRSPPGWRPTGGAAGG